MRILICSIFLLISFVAQAQDCTLAGRVTDIDGDPLPLVTVRIEGTNEGASTGLDGRYQFRLTPADSVVVTFSMVGFKKESRTLRNPKGRMNITLVMRPMTIDMGEVTVKEVARQLSGTQKLDVEKIKRMPSTSGNAVEEMVATQAGVSSHNELSSQYNVRGGSFDENVVYINGVEIYRPMLISSGQQEGLSIINSNMVQDISFSAGGFEASYGDRMSSALDITYQRPTKTEAKVSGSLLGADVFLCSKLGPFTMSHGLRYKTNAYLISSLQEKGEYHPSYIDYQTYMSWMPTERLTIDFIGHISQNKYDFWPENRMTNFGTMADAMSLMIYFDGAEHDLFRTFFGTLQSTYKFTKDSQLSLLLSAYSAREKESYDISGEYWLSNDDQQSGSLGVGKYLTHARNFINTDVMSVGMRYNLTLGAHKILAGVTLKSERTREYTREWERHDSAGFNKPALPDRLQMIYNAKAEATLNSTRLEMFAQDTWRTESKHGIMSLNYGVRLAHWSYNKETIVSPRVTLGWIPSWNENLTFRAGTGLYYQAPFFKELRDTITAANGNTHVEMNPNIKSTRSIHMILGADYQFRLGGRPFKFTAEAYYKHLSNLNAYTVDNLKIIYQGNNDANGYAMGVDFKLFGEFVPDYTSWISFSLMRAKQQINGVWCPQPSDQTFNLNIFFSDFFPGSTRWKMTMKGCLAGGLPFTAPHVGMDKVHFTSTTYRRVDMGMNYRLLDNEDRHNHRWRYVKNIWLGVDLFNVFGLNNISSYLWITDVNNNQFAVPNYLTGRQINARFSIEF